MNLKYKAKRQSTRFQADVNYFCSDAILWLYNLFALN